MDTATLRLEDLTRDNAEVIGLNGKLTGYCGYSLPLVKHIPTQGKRTSKDWQTKELG